MIAEELAKRMWTDAQGTYADDLLPYARALIEARELASMLDHKAWCAYGVDPSRLCDCPIVPFRASLAAFLGGE